MISDELQYLVKDSRINSNEILYKKIRKIEPKTIFETIILKYYIKQITVDNLIQQMQNDRKLYFK